MSKETIANSIVGRQQLQDCINMARRRLGQWEQLYQKASQLPDQDDPQMLELLATFANLVESEYQQIAEYQAQYTNVLLLDFKLFMNEERYAATKFLGGLEVMACKTAYDCACNHLMLSRIIAQISE